MKLNNLKKNFYIFFSIIISILVATLLWEKIDLQLNNTNVTKGFFVAKGYNPIIDTIRYIFFVGLPLIVFLFLNQKLNKRFIKISDLIFEENTKIDNNQSNIILISLIFIIFIFLEFFSVNFVFTNYTLDHFHDGNYLTPTQNYIFNKNFWLSSYLAHGSSNIFYPLLMWKIFGIESIGVTRTFTIFLVLILKLLSVLLSYQFTKITNLKKETKILFFTIFTSIIISMSNYTFLGASYYISHKDIYIILFLIFFIELFVDSRFRTLSLVSVCFIATATILLQIDKGVYINFILFFYSLYLILSKKYKNFLLIFFSLILCWSIVIGF